VIIFRIISFLLLFSSRQGVCQQIYKKLSGFQRNINTEKKKNELLFRIRKTYL